MVMFQVLVKAAGASATLALLVDSSDTAALVAQKYALATRGNAYKNIETRVVHCGNTLPLDATLAEAHIPPCSLLEILPRLCGGGGDGGSTGAESRSAYLEMYRGKQHDKVNPEEERLAKWTACHISGMPLQPPCVADELGNLFNKEAVVHALLAKSIPRSLSHITSMKHLVDVKLEDAQGITADAAVRFACPVTGLLMNGKSKFYLIQRGGQGNAFAVSERAIKELPTVVEEIVGGAWTAEDRVPLYPQGDEMTVREDSVHARRQAELNAKLEKKAAKAALKAGNSNNSNSNKRGLDSIDEGVEVGGGSTAVVKKVKKAVPGGAAAELMPSHADPKVWNSLFTDKSKEGKKKKEGNDYMVRALC